MTISDEVVVFVHFIKTSVSDSLPSHLTKQPLFVRFVELDVSQLLYFSHLFVYWYRLDILANDVRLSLGHHMCHTVLPRVCLSRVGNGVSNI